MCETPDERSPDRSALAARIRDAAYLEGDFTLSSGLKSKYYLDKYLFETDPVLLRDIARAMAGLLPERFDRLAGVELGGVPLATTLALETGKPFIIVRREAKAHGTARDFEGTLNPGDRLILVEDVLTTGAQAIAAARRLEQAGAKVIKVIYVVDRQQGAAENIARAGYEPAYLFTSEDLGIHKTPV
jgi:orotate phosphoribosyltransferase